MFWVIYVLYMFYLHSYPCSTEAFVSTQETASLKLTQVLSRKKKYVKAKEYFSASRQNTTKEEK